MRSIEICAGAGGQALGLEQAGFEHVALIEIDAAACTTLRENRPQWNVIEGDLRQFSATGYKDIDLLAGGVPCPPFSVAGKQLGHLDERDLFPEAIRLAKECNPKAIMLENVRGLFDSKFDGYRNKIKRQLSKMGYDCFWNLVQANHFGVPQLRPRTVLVAIKKEYANNFTMPQGNPRETPTVGQTLLNEMSRNGWPGAETWANGANGIAPTLVGGSKKHGGADLGPTRAKRAWETLGVDGMGLADQPPTFDFEGSPKLTVDMAALIQGFPPDWKIQGKKTPAYRQVGNAFPPPVAKAIGIAIKEALEQGPQTVKRRTRRMGARDKLRKYFLEHIGEIIESDTLREVSGGINEWGRRVRELRNEEGYQILTHKDRSDLKQNQYRLDDPIPKPPQVRKISKETRAFVLDRDGFTCQMCGAVAGEPHPYDPSRKVVLHMGHVLDKSLGGTDDPDNLKAICSICNEGASNTTHDRPSPDKLLVQIRRATRATQLEALGWLMQKYPDEAKKIVSTDE